MRVLVVEDDPMVSQLNQNFLKQHKPNAEIEVALTLEEARDKLGMNEYDLVLLDVYFPTGKGTDILKWIRNENIATEVILITADKSQETVSIALNYGAADFLIKPFSLDRFKEAVDRSLQRKRSLEFEGSAGQDTLDQIWTDEKERENSSSETPQQFMEKGLGAFTYKSIKDVILEQTGNFTADEIGKKAGLARVTVRRYMEYMVKDGFLEMELVYGKVGRPQHYYRIKN